MFPTVMSSCSHFFIGEGLGLVIFFTLHPRDPVEKARNAAENVPNKRKLRKYEGKFSDQKDRVGIQFVGYLAMQQKNV